MKSKYIVMPVLLFVLVFGSTSQTFAQVTTTGTRQESTLEKIKDILSSIQSIFSDTLAQVTGSYATVGAATAERFVTADFGKVTYYPNRSQKLVWLQISRLEHRLKQQ